MVTFTLENPGEYDETTDQLVGRSTTTVTGSAMKIKTSVDEVKRFEEGKLIGTEMITLFFVPNNYGEVPENGSTVVWEGSTWTQASRSTLAPDGVVIAARLLMVR